MLRKEIIASILVDRCILKSLSIEIIIKITKLRSKIWLCGMKSGYLRFINDYWANEIFFSIRFIERAKHHEYCKQIDLINQRNYVGQSASAAMVNYSTCALFCKQIHLNYSWHAMQFVRFHFI